VTNNSAIGDEWAARFATMMTSERPNDERAVEGEVIELLTPEEMGEADRRTIAAGTRSYLLMERAGQAVATAAARMAAPGARIAVLCGPGNNGGDGFIAARLLAADGYRVSVYLLGSREQLKGDAGLAVRAWNGPVEPARRDFAEGADLIIDALFGAGSTARSMAPPGLPSTAPMRAAPRSSPSTCRAVSTGAAAPSWLARSLPGKR
jgi:hypothetical protein